MKRVKLFNNSILYIIPIVFIFVIIFRITYSYQDTKNKEYEFAKKEAEVLNSYSFVHNNYYRKLFIDKVIPLNEKTLAALPAVSSIQIAKKFSETNSLNITAKAVTDRARNSDNQADDGEMEAIEYFQKNRDKREFFSDANSDYYQYGRVITIKKKCLACHGKKEDAPPYIQQKYKNAYNYKEGDVRGIMSIKVPKKNLDEYFMRGFFYSVIYDLVLLVALFIFIFYLIFRSKKANEILEQKVIEQTKELKENLITDTLTKLPNRQKLLDDLRENSNTSHLAVLNIDGFKEINDFYGNRIGDEVLKQITSLLSYLCKNDNSVLYKLPSDEFAILSLEPISSQEFLEDINDIVTATTQSKLKIEKNVIFISFSCGIANDSEHPLFKANTALEKAKATKKHLVVYDDSLDSTEKIKENIQGVSLLKSAIKNETIVPFFQPIYNLFTKKIEKYECLARIVQEDGSILSPFSFLPIAIKAKLYPNITKSILTKSFDYFQNKEYEFSINLSIEDVLNKETTELIFAKLKNYPTPSRVVFEILESEKIENYDALKEFIKKVKEYECKIAIDDFGSGYSNFSHILELNIDYLKIDASLVKNITTSENSKKITKTIIGFAKNLKLKTIAEFVEDKESLELLEKMGVDYIQGYYIGKPVPEI